ncbi:MAG: hypothetical protein IPI61_12305 [Syntrophaceae bacterium]|nr:hypothetical protein [Syntrophaceae bacterium]
MAILAISLDFRSGGQEVASLVGEALGYKCSGKDQSLAYMKAAGERWERLFRELDQERPSLWDRYDWEYRGSWRCSRPTSTNMPRATRQSSSARAAALSSPIFPSS